MNQTNRNPHNNLRRIFRLILLTILILAIFGAINISSVNPYSTDFLKFYASGKFWFDNKSIYTTLTLQSIPEIVWIDPMLIKSQIHPNLNPPLQTILLYPLVLIDFVTGLWVWSLISLILGLVSIYLIYNEYRSELHSLHVFELSIIFLLFFPTILTILLGQVSNILLFLITTAWIAARRGRDRFSGIVLGITLSLKIFTGLFIPVFLIQRRWKLLRWYMGTFLLVNLVSILILGLDEHITYLQKLSSVTWYSSSWNPSLRGFLTRIFGGAESIPLIDASTFGFILYLVFAVLVISLVLWLSNQQKNQTGYGFDLIYSLTIVGMLFLSPLGWSYYYVLLVIPLVVAGFLSWLRGDKLLIGLIIFAWLLCTIPHQQIQRQDIKLVDIFTWAGFPMYGLLLIGGVISILLLNGERRIEIFQLKD